VIEQSRQDAFPSSDHMHPVALRPHALDRQHNLPAELTGLVGRADAINELRRLLVSARLLTLTGAGELARLERILNGSPAGFRHRSTRFLRTRTIGE
jgi:hypothetical protein